MNNIFNSIFDPDSFVSQQTTSVRTFIKTAFVQAVGEVFAQHPDPYLITQLDSAGNKLSGVSVTVENPTDLVQYPSVVVRWLEQSVENAGVGHIEYIYDSDNSATVPFRHAYYRGQIELGIYALSSVDRDLVADSLVQLMRMPDMATYTQQYFNQIFNDDDNSNTLNYINVDTDRILPVGESVSQVPWLAENALQYKGGYRSNVFGEFYSLPPNFTFSGYIEAVNVYPYIGGVEPVPNPDPSDPAVWLPTYNNLPST